jgi:hypothetical protein
MRARSILTLVLGGALVLALGGTTVAQTTGGAGDISMQRPVTLSPQDMMKEANGSYSRMENGRNVVRGMLDKARNTDRDVVKTLCLNDKLNQIDVTIRSTKERLTSMEGAVQRNDGDLVKHEYTIVTEYRKRVDKLVSEANGCIGAEGAFIGKTEVVTRVDPTIPDDDPTQYPATDPTLVTAPPQCVSCDI